MTSIDGLGMWKAGCVLFGSSTWHGGENPYKLTTSVPSIIIDPYYIMLIDPTVKLAKDNTIGSQSIGSMNVRVSTWQHLQCQDPEYK